MDYVAYLKEQIQLGYSKTELEQCLGLSRNTLSGVVSGKKKLSAKDRLKIDVWVKSNTKPNPLEVKEWLVRTKLLTFNFLKTSEIAKVDDISVQNKSKKQLAKLAKATTENSFNGESKIPTTFEEMKSQCPKELTGVDKAMWISDNRLKYNL